MEITIISKKTAQKKKQLNDYCTMEQLRGNLKLYKFKNYIYNGKWLKVDTPRSVGALKIM